MFNMLSKQDKQYIDKKFEDFALMVQRGFQEINDTKADKSEVAEGFNRIEERLINMEGRMNTLETKLVTVPNNRLDRVEDDIRIIKAKLNIEN